MSDTLAGQLIMYFIAASLLIAVSLQLDGEYDFVTAVRDELPQPETA